MPVEQSVWQGSRNDKQMQTEERLVTVTEVPKQAKEDRVRWTWTEPSVWSSRMLSALESGVKGGKWYSLIDKIYRRKTLEKAFERVRKNGGAAGSDGVSIGSFEGNKERELAKLEEQIRSGSYEPRPVKRVYIPKPGSEEKRPLGIPAVRDRVVQTAVRMTIEPIFERTFAEGSYGFRPGRGAKDALREVDRLMKEGSLYVVEADIKSYFDTISHEKLARAVESQIADKCVLSLIESFMKQNVLEEMKSWTPTGGTPQGGVISPLLANIYLNPLDHEMAKAGNKMIRYADDFVVLCRTREQALEAMQRIESWMQEAQLTLHPEKTRIVDMHESEACFEFLGYHFEHTKRSGKIKRWPRQKSIKKLRETIRLRTRRANGHSLDTIIKNVNPVLKGWYNYFRHSTLSALGHIDSWVRMRLRSILRKRMKRKGVGRGWDHRRWPNSFFVAQGLFCMSQALGAAHSIRRRG